MGYFAQHRLCTHCNKYETRDRTSLLRHQQRCSAQRTPTKGASASSSSFSERSESELSFVSSPLSLKTKSAQPARIGGGVSKRKAITPSKPKPKLEAQLKFPPMLQGSLSIVPAFPSSSPSTPLWSATENPGAQHKNLSNYVRMARTSSTPGHDGSTLGTWSPCFPFSETAALYPRVLELEKQMAEMMMVIARFGRIEERLHTIELWLSHK